METTREMPVFYRFPALAFAGYRHASCVPQCLPKDVDAEEPLAAATLYPNIPFRLE